MDPRLQAFRKLVYEPVHTETVCWCNPRFVSRRGVLLEIIHNEQRDVLSDFVRKNFL